MIEKLSSGTGTVFTTSKIDRAPTMISGELLLGLQ